MSIIYDALKKIDSGSKAKSIEPKLLLKAAGKRGFKKVLLILFLIILFPVLVLGYFFMGYKKEKVPVFSIAQKSHQAAKIKDASGFKDYLTRKISPKPNIGEGLVLEGIVYEDGSAIAIVNETFLRESEMIGNFKVVKITQKTVELLNPATEETLKLSLPF
ncbi:MAG: hypothetical protein PHU64_03155 [Candidatus Omnitrophica bacterium]|nr:hypothetical protein [Candidatus Omnitrophota bacterium]MDD5429962.1 hypothetical protein [Candidatus Omnitrophota bacterium]